MTEQYMSLPAWVIDDIREMRLVTMGVDNG